LEGQVVHRHPRAEAFAEVSCFDHGPLPVPAAAAMSGQGREKRAGTIAVAPRRLAIRGIGRTLAKRDRTRTPAEGSTFATCSPPFAVGRVAFFCGPPGI
ncbi:hypothetical protein, partial [Salmonella sp. SAL4457]|uniref:hypothetical protein n=1 Tax=Salmonella sp. SAL4457 TaxID=3159912 RepID=UPI0039793A93